MGGDESRAQRNATRPTSGRSSRQTYRLRLPAFIHEKVGLGDAGLADRQTLHAVLSKPENRYLVRQICWMFTVEGLETYLLVPRDSNDFQLLVEAVRPNPGPDDLDAVVGVKSPIAPPEMANGLRVPTKLSPYYDR